jgi:AraC-like DNA-binding protein
MVTSQPRLESAARNACMTRNGGAPRLRAITVRSSSGLLLTRLQIPWRTGIDLESGRVSVAAANPLARQIPKTRCEILPCGTRFDLLLLPETNRSPASCRFVFVDARAEEASEEKRLSIEAARLVFKHPARRWTLALLASCLNLESSKLSARLFFENSSVRDIIRTQRTMRALFMLAGTDLTLPEVAHSSGWATLASFKKAFREILMTDPLSIERPTTAAPTQTRRIACVDQPWAVTYSRESHQRTGVETRAKPISRIS